METTTATKIEDNSDIKGNADDDGDNGNDHNGNNNKAMATIPPGQDHDEEKTAYNNQLNGGQLTVEEVEAEAEERGDPRAGRPCVRIGISA
jgi:hypothetical protein